MIISKDSLSDVLWIKKKQFQNLLLSKTELPFPKLKSRFRDNEFESLQNSIKVIELDSYIERIKQKYNPLRMINVEKLESAFMHITDDPGITTTRIKYPQMARENATQGTVRIAYVLTKDASVEEIYIIKRLGEGCTESVIDSIKDLGKKLKDKGYKSNENIYIEGSTKFTLN